MVAQIFEVSFKWSFSAKSVSAKTSFHCIFAFTYLHSSSPASSGAQSSRGPEETTSPTHVSFWSVRDGGALGRRLEHNAANVVYALGDSFAGSTDGDSSLCWVGQHLAGHLDRGSSHFTDFFDLGPALADKRPALRCWDNQPESARASEDTISTFYLSKVVCSVLLSVFGVPFFTLLSIW